MNALQLARSYGLRVEFANLGEWGSVELNSEYDPHGPAIRLNARVAERLAGAALGNFVCLCVAHEIYHHRERLGEIACLPNRTLREAAAEAYARTFVEPT